MVTDYAVIHGESRSHDPRFVRTITNTYRDAFRAAAKHVRDDRVVDHDAMVRSCGQPKRQGRATNTRARESQS